jgi:hypothetical protein
MDSSSIALCLLVYYGLTIHSPCEGATVLETISKDLHVLDVHMLGNHASFEPARADICPLSTSLVIQCQVFPTKRGKRKWLLRCNGCVGRFSLDWTIEDLGGGV